MFFYLVKCTLWLLHVFYPIISLLLHIALASIWAYGIHIQTSPDTIDPKRVNNGAPWYITKNCNIVEDKQIRGYCMQAKSSFAISIVMLYVHYYPLTTTKLIMFQYHLRPLRRPCGLLPDSHHRTKVCLRHQKSRKEGREGEMGILPG